MHRTEKWTLCAVCASVDIERKLKSWSPLTYMNKKKAFEVAVVCSYAQCSDYVCTQDDSTAPMDFFFFYFISHSLPNGWNKMSGYMVIVIHCGIKCTKCARCWELQLCFPQNRLCGYWCCFFCHLCICGLGRIHLEWPKSPCLLSNGSEKSLKFLSGNKSIDFESSLDIRVFFSLLLNSQHHSLTRQHLLNDVFFPVTLHVRMGTKQLKQE